MGSLLFFTCFHNILEMLPLQLTIGLNFGLPPTNFARQNMYMKMKRVPDPTFWAVGLCFWMVRMEGCAQEMCLQIYGGLTMSSELDRFTNEYRTREQAHPHPTDIPPPEPDSEPERSQTAPAIASPLAMSRQAWESLDSISVQDEFQTPVPSLQAVPHFLVEPVKKALKLALRGIVEPNPAAAITAERSWKLLLLIPRMLLGRPAQTGAIGKRALRQRASNFAAGHWHQLLDGVRGPEPGRRRAPSSAEACAERAAAQVRRGELSRARQTLTSSPLAPGTDETLAILQDPTRRPPALQTALPTNLQE